jgi:hypothetical protein
LLRNTANIVARRTGSDQSPIASDGNRPAKPRIRASARYGR